MKNLLLFTVLVTLPQLLVGCREREVVTEFRNGIMYIKDSDALYTGKDSVFYDNGQKKFEVNYKDGKAEGLNVEWYQNGKKKQEVNHKDGKRDGLKVVWYENG